MNEKNVVDYGDIEKLSNHLIINNDYAVDVCIKTDDEKLIPQYKTGGSAGCDFKASEECVINPGEIKAVPTGVRIKVPIGMDLDMRPRSGLSLNDKMIAILGTIDNDYRGELRVIMLNYSDKPYTIHKYDRIGQGVFVWIHHAVFKVVDELDDTERGDGGFGSTGKN
jgi:dUTP pyrophosphatase